MSKSNSNKEIKFKKKLYFASGAEEVWLCNQDGKMSFYTKQGLNPNSVLVQKFPKYIKI
jgi:hypothetical protein